jgi:hypothetical protein
LTVVLPRSRRIQARVYFVDGKVAVADGSLATDGRPEPTSLVEAPT